MTEAEAKTRWCPFAASRALRTRSDNETDMVVNFCGPSPHKSVTPFCLASDCMAWHWDVRSQVEKLSEGYCGLAR